MKGIAKVKMGLLVCLLFLAACQSLPAQKAVTVSSPQTVRIVLNDLSSGLQQDQAIYQRQFESLLKVTSATAMPQGHVTANLFLEHVTPSHLFSTAPHNLLMVNQEFVDPPQKLSHIDLVLCKSRHAVELMKDYRKKNGLSFRLYYTKFTSIKKGENAPKNFNLAAHFAGKSRFKNTSAVLLAWLAHPEFPPLVASCRNPDESPAGAFGCFGYHVKPLLPYLGKAHNLTVFTGPIPADRFKEWQREAGIYIVPSAVEGYGHYINEGRQQGAIVITTNAPPMNEMVQDGINGRLVNYDTSFIFNKHSQAPSVTVKPDALAKVVQEVLALSLEDKTRMGEAARQQYLEDTRFFEERMRMLAGSLAENGDFSGIQHLLE